MKDTAYFQHDRYTCSKVKQEGLYYGMEMQGTSLATYTFGHTQLEISKIFQVLSIRIKRERGGRAGG
jgi:hypothetical protein